MTTIQATINISGTTTPLDGYIRVLIESIFSDEDTLFVPVIKDFPLVSGAVSFDLEPSDVARVAYKFQIYQTVPDTIGEDENGDPVPVVEPDILLREFRAVVPYSATPIKFKDLAEQVGVRYDAQDAALLTLARYLQASDTFWDTLVQNIWNLKGSWDNLAFYRRGDVVIFNGSAYQYIQSVATQGNLPTNTSFWRLLVSKGDTGTGTSGNDTAYGISWNGSTDAPSRNAVYDKIETLATLAQLATYAPLASPGLTGNPTAPTQTTGNRSTRLATTDFVGNEINAIGTVPIGAIIPWGTTSAPSKYRVLTNPGEVVSQTTYAALFALYGTLYNTGSEGTGNFRLPNSTSMPTLSSANMRWIVYTGV